ncbi:hypothetical protein KIPB_008613, partial [Kipferlia bialata]
VLSLHPTWPGCALVIEGCLHPIHPSGSLTDILARLAGQLVVVVPHTSVSNEGDSPVPVSPPPSLPPGVQYPTPVHATESDAWLCECLTKYLTALAEDIPLSKATYVWGVQWLLERLPSLSLSLFPSLPSLSPSSAHPALTCTSAGVDPGPLPIQTQQTAYLRAHLTRLSKAERDTLVQGVLQQYKESLPLPSGCPGCGQQTVRYGRAKGQLRPGMRLPPGQTLPYVYIYRCLGGEGECSHRDRGLSTRHHDMYQHCIEACALLALMGVSCRVESVFAAEWPAYFSDDKGKWVPFRSLAGLEDGVPLSQCEGLAYTPVHAVAVSRVRVWDLTPTLTDTQRDRERDRQALESRAVLSHPLPEFPANLREHVFRPWLIPPEDGNPHPPLFHDMSSIATDTDAALYGALSDPAHPAFMCRVMHMSV